MNTGYLASEGFEQQLERELSQILYRHGRLFVAAGPPQRVHWVQNIWLNPERISFRSISEAARLLRSLYGLWAFYPHGQIRRGLLISAQLPHFSPRPLSFPSKPLPPLGSWTLLDSHTLLASSHCSTPVPHGEFRFQESAAPPSRAYLKLWELFTRLGVAPAPQERCLEVGASPGSWTWVLQNQHASVIAVDRAPLFPSIASRPHTTFLKQDAFSLPPDPHIDWVFSDVICPPDKLFTWIRRWLDAGIQANFVCTLKFRGNAAYGAIRDFESIEGSQLFHLFHNKHELTWVKLRP